MPAVFALNVSSYRSLVSVKTRGLLDVPAMSTFVSRISPVTGKKEWVPQDENYDFHQEVARSAYADMLHDTERNQKYYAALHRAIELMHSRGKAANVLDIGTGTGLLSMMAVRSGADTVTACEAFQPMAKCAKQVIDDNMMTEKIKVIPKRSTDITVGPDGDMASRANILVTEVFDTELIGEGAVGTFNHAHQCLLEDDCIVVPSAANMYAQVVESDTVRRWNRFHPIEIPNYKDVASPDDVVRCPGAASVHDLQLDQLSCDLFQPITPPLQVFRFDFSGKSPLERNRHSCVKAVAQCGGQSDAVFMWWDLEMDIEGQIMLSCAPRWAHPTPHEMQWRDHWMQAVYYPATRLTVKKEESIAVHSYHDEYSLWFDVVQDNGLKSGNPPVALEPPVCRCGAHVACSRPRIGMLNNVADMEKYTHALWRVIQPDSVCLCLSDMSLLPLIAARLGAKQVIVASEQLMTNGLLRRYLQCNQLSDRIKIIEKAPRNLTYEDFLEREPTVLIGEPYFATSILPWQNIYFWYARTELADFLPDNLTVVPCAATMKCIGVDFQDLWKIRAPVGTCQGFKLDTFDQLIERSSAIADAVVEPQPLWEYPGKPMTEVIGLMHFDLTRPLVGLKTVDKEGYITFSNLGRCSGVAVWMEFHLDPVTTVTTGLVAPPQQGENLQWEKNVRQGVHLLPTPINIEESTKLKLRYKVTFKPKSGEFDFDFRVGEVEIKPKPMKKPET